MNEWCNQERNLSSPSLACSLADSFPFLLFLAASLSFSFVDSTQTGCLVVSAPSSLFQCSSLLLLGAGTSIAWYFPACSKHQRKKRTLLAKEREAERRGRRPEPDEENRAMEADSLGRNKGRARSSFQLGTGTNYGEEGGNVEETSGSIGKEGKTKGNKV